MKKLTLLFVICIQGCVIAPRNESNSGQLNPENITYRIEGVSNPGDYTAAKGITISMAIDNAGGLRNCDSCFKTHGEEYLWATFAGAKVTRVNGIGYFRVKKEELDTWGIETGVKIKLLHYAL